MPDLFTLVLQIGVIVAAARAMGMLFVRFQQPQVIGEMAAGIMLGPSFLGWLAPGAFKFLFPPESLGYLNGLSQVGILFFMFLVGLSIHPSELRRCGRAAVFISQASILVPFVFGAGFSVLLYKQFAGAGVPFSSFALFMGAAMSITAFPVLARILKERNLLDTPMGTLSISCAAAGDVAGWCILAGIVALVRASEHAPSIGIMFVAAAVFGLAMVFGVRRLLRGFETHYTARGRLTENAISLIVLVLLASALVTEALGFHLLFGAFLAGCVMPKNREFVHDLQQKFELITVALLLPLFFAFTGLRTSIGLIHGAAMWSFCVLLIILATVGKLGGSMAAARFSGRSWRDSAALGILMNTRGLMELVILNIGLDLGIIQAPLFSMMVLMALITTLMATPLLHKVYPDLSRIQESARSASKTAAAVR